LAADGPARLRHRRRDRDRAAAATGRRRRGSPTSRRASGRARARGRARPRAAAVAPSPTARLAALAVSDADFYRPVLYTWTPAASIGALRYTRELLTATAATGRFVSPFNRALAQVARTPGAGRALAQALTTDPALIRRRYAWPAPFATVLGLGPRSYGTALVRIELAPEAWIARFDPSAREPFAIVDAAGQPVAMADVLAAPTRLGAIFHVRTDAWQGVAYREYVVVSPAMVAAWSIATPAIRAELAAERALLADLELGVAALADDDATASAVPAWRGGAPAGLAAAWHAALAFDNQRYRPTRANLRRIDRALAAWDPAGAPLVVTRAP
jgi:hypothetical protein